jgi:hypothetical protein
MIVAISALSAASISLALDVAMFISTSLIPDSNGDLFYYGPVEIRLLQAGVVTAIAGLLAAPFGALKMRLYPLTISVVCLFLWWLWAISP